MYETLAVSIESPDVFSDFFALGSLVKLLKALGCVGKEKIERFIS